MNNLIKETLEGKKTFRELVNEDETELAEGQMKKFSEFPKEFQEWFMSEDIKWTETGYDWNSKDGLQQVDSLDDLYDLWKSGSEG